MVERGPIDQSLIGVHSSSLRLKTVLNWMDESGMPFLPGMNQPNWVKGSLSRKMLGGDFTSLTVRRHLFGENELNADTRTGLRTLSRAIQIGNLTRLMQEGIGVNPRKDARRKAALLKLRNLELA